MDRIAIIADIHGNLPALEAVLHDIHQRGIERILCLGDIIGKGPSTAEVIDICRNVCEQVVFGNWELSILNLPQFAVCEWHYQFFTPERLAYLKNLSATIEFQMSGKQVRLYHASQLGAYYRVQMYDSREKHLAMFDNTPFTGTAMRLDVVGYADIHVAFQHHLQHRLLFNTGSVGNPIDMTMASYAILEGVYGSAEPAPFSVQTVRLPYDIERAVRQAEASDMPERDEFIHELRTAEYRKWRRK